MEDLNFEDIRSAFIYYFFDPVHKYSNFIFNPDGFRQYLYSEWCLRSLAEYLLPNTRTNQNPVQRSGDEIGVSMSVVPPAVEVLRMLDEIYEKLGSLTRFKPSAVTDYLYKLGVAGERSRGGDWVEEFYTRVKRHAQLPPFLIKGHIDEVVNVEGGLAEGLRPLNITVNYWYHCLVATFGLYRGMGKDPENDKIFEMDRRALSRFLHALHSVTCG